ncbi:MAG: glycosyltransferase [Candidatus Bathyarchaeia archaeon]
MLKASKAKIANMRILQVIPVFTATFGGPVTVVRSISKELAKRHEVTVYTTSALDQKRDFEDLPVEVKVDGYNVFYFPRIIQFSGFNFSQTMVKMLKETIDEYDVVHLHSWRHFQDIIVHHYAKKYRIPYILQAHGSLQRIIAKRRLKWIYDVLFGYGLLWDAAKVIALSSVEAKQYKSMGVLDEKIAIIPNGIDLTEYANLPPKGSFKRKFGIPEEKKMVLYLGRIHRSKGIGFLIKAYAYLTNKMGVKDAVLVIAGPDDGYLNEAMSLVHCLDISNSVLFTGFISSDDKLAALVDTDVFVTPSFYGFPITFLEACAVGTPIVTTSLGDYLEWIDGKVGYVTKPSINDFAEKTYKIITIEEVQKNMSRNCLNLAKEFSIEKLVCKLERVYKEALNRQD